MKGPSEVKQKEERLMSRRLGGTRLQSRVTRLRAGQICSPFSALLGLHFLTIKWR